jgi:hypothetical protein
MPVYITPSRTVEIQSGASMLAKKAISFNRLFYYCGKDIVSYPYSSSAYDTSGQDELQPSI